MGFDELKRLGVVLKRALYFITCNGRMMYPVRLEENYLIRNLTEKKNVVDEVSVRQMSLFDMQA